MMRRLVFTGLSFLALLIAPFGLADEGRALTVPEIESLERGEVISEIWRDKSQSGGQLEAYAAVHINAAPQQIWAVMNSCDASVEIVKDMASCEVLETAPNGAWDIRAQSFRAPFPLGKFRTEFRTDFTPFETMHITRTGGDMKTQDAIWVITPLSSGHSRVTYRASVALKVPVPRFMMRRALRKDTPELMDNLRRFVEASAVSGVDSGILAEDDDAPKP